MLKFADLIEKNASELASWESKAMGMPIQVAEMILGKTVEVFRCMATLLMLTVKPNPKQTMLDGLTKFLESSIPRWMGSTKYVD
jgi:acyl-CoA reductase-like NAD-dependent aldehyde dehydrogenase